MTTGDDFVFAVFSLSIFVNFSLRLREIYGAVMITKTMCLSLSLITWSSTDPDHHVSYISNTIYMYTPSRGHLQRPFKRGKFVNQYFASPHRPRLLIRNITLSTYIYCQWAFCFSLRDFHVTLNVCNFAWLLLRPFVSQISASFEIRCINERNSENAYSRMYHILI